MSNYDVWEHGLGGLFETTLEDLTGVHTTAAKCLSYVVEKYMQVLKECSEHIVIFRDIENLPEKLLDYLAIEWSLPYYEDTLEREAKIKLVEEGFNWRRTAGTVEGVETLAKKMFGDGEVSEWYEYGGMPGYFKITTNAYLIENLKEFFAMLLRKEKNVRSWLEAVEVTRDISIYGYAGVKFLICHVSSPPLIMQKIIWPVITETADDIGANGFAGVRISEGRQRKVPEIRMQPVTGM